MLSPTTLAAHDAYITAGPGWGDTEGDDADLLHADCREACGECQACYDAEDERQRRRDLFRLAQSVECRAYGIGQRLVVGGGVV